MATKDDTLKVPRDWELEWLLCHSEGEAGMASSFGSLVDAAMGGWGGGGDRERRITGWRFGRGGSVERGRALRTRFMAIESARHRDVLLLAYGPYVWPRETMRHLGQLAGVALIAEASQAGYERALARAGSRDRGIGAWLVSACLRGSGSELAPIVAECRSLVDAARVVWDGGAAPVASERRRRLYRWEAPTTVLPARVWA